MLRYIEFVKTLRILGRFLKWLWVLSWAPIFGGLLILVSDRCGRIQELVKHVGFALLVAYAVAVILHIGELKRHIEEFAKLVFLEGKYLATLQNSTLLDLRRRITDVIAGRVVTNTKHYDYRSIEDVFERLLFSGVLGESNKSSVTAYRQEYEETIELEFMTGKALKERLSEAQVTSPDAENTKSIRERLCQAVQCSGGEGEAKADENEVKSAVVDVDDEGIYVQITTTTQYEYVSSKSQIRPHPETVDGEVSKIKGIHGSKQVKWFVGGTPKTAKQVDLNFADNDSTRAYNGRFDGLKYSVDGIVKVYRQLVEIDHTSNCSFILVHMTLLTKAPKITIASNISVRHLNVVTTGLDGDRTDFGGGGKILGVKYAGWMASMHGYMIYWHLSKVRSELLRDLDKG